MQILSKNCLKNVPKKQHFLYFVFFNLILFWPKIVKNYNVVKLTCDMLTSIEINKNVSIFLSYFIVKSLQGDRILEVDLLSMSSLSA